MRYKVELMAVGTELLLGNIVNTNAQWLSTKLSALGVDVLWHTVVGDNPTRLKQALEIARMRADIILTTGGLGPTYDDLTKETVCDVFGKALVVYPEIEAQLRHYFQCVLCRTMTPNNLRQTQLPEDATIFSNPVGTACGCAFCVEDTHVVMLPGPPHECNTMFEHHVEDYLRALSSDVIVSHDIMTFGIGESEVDDLLQPWMASLENPSLATYAKPSEVRLRATAKAESVEAAEELLKPILEQVHQQLQPYIYGLDVENMETACFQALTEHGKTFATAESCTGGLIAQRITALSGASNVYRGGVVSYWTSVKADVLGVPQELLMSYGAVSQEVALSMAQGARLLTGADIGVSVTGVAGPNADEDGKEVGLVYVAVDTPEGGICRCLHWGKRPRVRIQELSANYALNLVRKQVLKQL